MKTIGIVDISLHSWCMCGNGEIEVSERLRGNHHYYVGDDEHVKSCRPIYQKELKEIFKRHLKEIKKEIMAIPKRDKGKQEFCCKD